MIWGPMLSSGENPGEDGIFSLSTVPRHVPFGPAVRWPLSTT